MDKKYLKDHLIGHTINTDNSSLVSSANYAEIIGANFYQIFLASPQKYNCPRKPEKDLMALNKQLKEKNIKIVIHASFMLNFCNPPSTYQHKEAVKLLICDLKESVKLNAIGVVIHMGKQLKLDEKTALKNYVTGVNTVLKNTPSDSIIIFETGAGQGSEICTSIYDLGKLYLRFSKKDRKRIKFCIDTCHVFSAGYHLGNVSYVDLFNQLVDTHLGWDKVACIHFNDSKCEVNSMKDRHADIGKGNINVAGLKKFFKICIDKNIPVVLETPCDVMSDIDQINLLKSWI